MAGFENQGGLGGLGGFFQRPVVQDTLNAVFDSMISSPSNNMMQGFGQSYDRSIQRREDAQQRAAFEQALIAAGMDPAQARTMAANPQAAKFALDQQQSTQTKNTTRDWLLGQGFSETDADAAVANPAILSQIMKRAQGGGDAQYGLNPIWGTDENGNPALGVLGNDGSFKKIDTGGFALSTGTEQIDLGDRFAIKDKRSGEIIGYIPKENYKEAFDTASGSAQGKATAEAQSALPGARDMAALINSQVEGLKSDPYLNNMLGPVNSRLPNMSTEAARVQAKMDQLSGGAFLQARQMLKGGGAITDFESNKAEQAFIRMNAAQSPDDFKKALDEFNQAVQDGVRKLEMQSGGASSAPPAAAAPAGTSLKDKYGLD